MVTKLKLFQRSLTAIALALLVGARSSLAAAPASADALSTLRSALTFHASFDGSADATFALGDNRVFSASNMNQPRTGTPGLPRNVAVSLARGEGRFGGALRFHKKVPDMIFFQAKQNVAYRTNNWSGTVSFWIKLNPDEDLEPGYCDPLQITPREWNDAAFFVDFSKDERPRHFRLGAFADRAIWDPNKRDYDRVPLTERPLVTVTKPPFSRERWTHIVFTFANFNTGRKDGVAKLYLDAQPQGAITGREQTFTWEPAQAIVMLGLNYTGLYDDLAIFNRDLTEAEIGTLHRLPEGIHSLNAR